MDVYTSDSSDTDSREQNLTLDFSHKNLQRLTLDEQELEKAISSNNLAENGKLCAKDIEILLLHHNSLKTLPSSLCKFVNLKVLDLSNNGLTSLPTAIFDLPLVTLIAKNNQLTNKSLPKTFLNEITTTTTTTTTCFKEINLSGNQFTLFPEQVLELKTLKYLYLGGNKIEFIPKDIWKMQSLQVLSLGGNLLREVPESVGMLSQMQALVLCDNLIEHLPTSIARLKNLKSLFLHKNRLKHLPKDIVALKNLTELSLRDNPLVVRFVQDIALNPPTLLELAARVVKSQGVRFEHEEIPNTLLEYLTTASCCVNPNCKGVFFDNRVEHIKFVDFCGMYRVPLLQYLCSSKCIEPEPRPSTSRASSGFMMRKVLLG